MELLITFENFCVEEAPLNLFEISASLALVKPLKQFATFGQLFYPINTTPHLNYVSLSLNQK